MIYSMTAFARNQRQGDWGMLVCEIRSINHRFLEVGVYLPELLRALEMPTRECIKRFLKRGKIECNIRYQATPAQTNMAYQVNAPLARELCEASETISGFLKQPAPICATDILRFPGVLTTMEADLTVLQSVLFELLESTLADLVTARQREGEALKELLLQRSTLIMHELGKVRERFPVVKQEQLERIQKRFAEAKLELDANRIEQEMLLFVQKIDVAEEIERAETHVKEINRIVNEGGAIGRRLDFLLQELNREANTLGSKSIDSVLTHAAVEMKVLIEQMREQIQNIE